MHNKKNIITAYRNSDFSIHGQNLQAMTSQIHHCDSYCYNRPIGDCSTTIHRSLCCSHEILDTSYRRGFCSYHCNYYRGCLSNCHSWSCKNYHGFRLQNFQNYRGCKSTENVIRIQAVRVQFKEFFSKINDLFGQIKNTNSAK